MLSINNDIFLLRKLAFSLSLLSFLLAIACITNRFNEIGSLFLLSFIFMIFWFYFLNETYKEYKAVYTKYLPAKAIPELLNKGNFIFKYDCLVYCIKTDCKEINWVDFSGYELVGLKHIVLHRKNLKAHNLIISQTEMDKSDFLKAVEHIKKRLKKINKHVLHNSI